MNKQKGIKTKHIEKKWKKREGNRLPRSAAAAGGGGGGGGRISVVGESYLKITPFHFCKPSFEQGKEDYI